jgi:Domain of unknown function (DUF4153)
MAVPARPDHLRHTLRSHWLDLSVALPADRRVLVASAAAAVTTDLAVRAGIIGVAGALLIATVAAGILASGRVKTLQARLIVAIAPLFGVWLFVRTSPWLLIPDLVVAVCLLTLGVSLGRRNVFDLTLPATAARGVQVFGHALAGPSYVVAAARTIAPSPSLTGRARARAVLRGVLIAAPLLVVLGLLLASADAVFASLFHLDVDPPSVMTHTIAVVFGGWVMGGFLRAASGTPIGRLPRAPRMGSTEALIVLGLMNALFLAFAVAQLVALSAGGRRVIETAGLTYAEYARRGFFQLLAVAAITLAAVLALRAVAAPSNGAPRRWFTVLALLTVALTLVIVFVAVRRLGLYANVFGLTMLRLYCTVFAWWIGAVFVLLGLMLAGVGGGRTWLPSAAVAVGLAGLLWLNTANPEALVVRHNVAFAQATGRFDPAYVSGLSDDAIPTLVSVLPELPTDARELVLSQVCPARGPDRTGWAAFNLARDRALESLASACAGSA